MKTKRTKKFERFIVAIALAAIATTANAQTTLRQDLATIETGIRQCDFYKSAEITSERGDGVRIVLTTADEDGRIMTTPLHQLSSAKAFTITASEGEYGLINLRCRVGAGKCIHLRYEGSNWQSTQLYTRMYFPKHYRNCNFREVAAAIERTIDEHLPRLKEQ